MRKHKVILVTGGARSGKSAFAAKRAMGYRKRAFIATATAVDKEMSERIRRHRNERGSAFMTVEEPLDLARALARVPCGTDVAVVDCLTVWLGNLMHKHGARGSFAETARFLEALESPPCDLLIVTNEVGDGIVPANAMARCFRDLAGGLNRAVAERADEVFLLVCGIAVALKRRNAHGKKRASRPMTRRTRS